MGGESDNVVVRVAKTQEDDKKGSILLLAIQPHHEHVADLGQVCIDESSESMTSELI
jgi:hypothetical protein